VDWKGVAMKLVERAARPTVLLDRRGKIRLFNLAMEQLLGWPRERVLGTRWSPANENLQATSSWLGQVLRKNATQASCKALSSDGLPLQLDFDVAQIGAASEAGTLLTVVRATPLALAAESGQRPNQDFEYVITAHATEFGRMHQLTQLGRETSFDASSAPTCFELLHRQRSACEDCPVLRPAREGWPRTTTRRRSLEEAGFELVSATPRDATTIRLSVRFVTDTALHAIQSTWLRQIADDAQLSARERAVLDYLLLGRSLGDIALLLQVSRHTVKFHQANILRKLGADSRADIVRLARF
jgi:PAS domain S-box-containing protein